MNPDFLQHRLKVSSIPVLVALLIGPMFVGLFSLATAAAQSLQQKREIISDDFIKNRPKVTTSPRSNPKASARPSSQKPRTYKFASSTNTDPTHTYKYSSQLGITVWRLRPKSGEEKTPTLLVRDAAQISQWVPERVEAEMEFRKGDRVRLSIESARTGFLYVVDQDLFVDGTTGDPMLIYPWRGMSQFENHVRPGRVIDIPAQENDPSYFTCTPMEKSQRGELLTLIVTQVPLQLPLTGVPLKISNQQFAQWVKLWGARNERFELKDGVGQVWTAEESLAARRRGTRQLTRDDPPPQTIYHVGTANNSGFLVNLRLSYDW